MLISNKTKQWKINFPFHAALNVSHETKRLKDTQINPGLSFWFFFKSFHSQFQISNINRLDNLFMLIIFCLSSWKFTTKIKFIIFIILMYSLRLSNIYFILILFYLKFHCSNWNSDHQMRKHTEKNSYFIIHRLNV